MAGFSGTAGNIFCLLLPNQPMVAIVLQGSPRVPTADQFCRLLSLPLSATLDRACSPEYASF